MAFSLLNAVAAALPLNALDVDLKFEKVRFTLSNYHKNSIFNLQLQNQNKKGHPTVETEQIWPLRWFSFCEK